MNENQSKPLIICEYLAVCLSPQMCVFLDTTELTKMPGLISDRIHGTYNQAVRKT